MSLSVEQKTEIKSLAFGHRDEKLKLGVKLFYCSEAVAELWVTGVETKTQTNLYLKNSKPKPCYLPS
jgi:hypothetical protein